VTARVGHGHIHKIVADILASVVISSDTHWRKIQRKAATQIGALVRTTASTWGASFLRARQVYSAVVGSSLAYGAAIWHSPTKGPDGKAQGIAAKLTSIQNKCLRAVAGAYRATPTRTLEVETHVPPMDLYLDSRLAAFQNRLASSGVGQLIEKACSTIQARIRNRRGRKSTIQEKRREWVEQREGWTQRSNPTRPIRSEKQRVLEAWKSRWHAQEGQRRARAQNYWDQIKRPPDPTILHLHEHLHKAESAMLVQLRTGRTGLRHFLNKAQVPGYELEQRNRGTGPETPRHVLLHCPHEEERRIALREANWILLAYWILPREPYRRASG
jgi:hypothetical protein